MLIRLLDIVFALSGLVLGFPVLILLTIIGLFDTGSPIFRQQRVDPKVEVEEIWNERARACARVGCI